MGRLLVVDHAADQVEVARGGRRDAQREVVRPLCFLTTLARSGKLGKLHTIPNVYTYLDVAHYGWLG